MVKPSTDSHFGLANELVNWMAVFFAVVPDLDSHDFAGVLRVDVAVLGDPVVLLTTVLSKTRLPGVLTIDSNIEAKVHFVEDTSLLINVSFQGVDSYESVVLLQMVLGIF